MAIVFVRCGTADAVGARMDASTHIRSLACIDLLGALADGDDVEVTLDVAVRDGQAPEPCAPVAFVADRTRAIHALRDLGGVISAAGDAFSCVTGVARLEVRVRIDGDDVLATGFPLGVLKRMAPMLDGLLGRLGAFGDDVAVDAAEHFTIVARVAPRDSAR